MDLTIHKTAEVSAEAKIGEGTKIWQNAQIARGSVVGDNCIIGHNCAIFGAKIGKGVKLQANTDVWEGVALEDYVFVGPSAVFTNDPNPRAKYPKKDFPQYGKWLPTLVKEGASIGANATIVCGSVVGRWAFVGAGAVVKGDVPDYAVIVGVPAKQIGWICECGNRLEFKREELKQQEKEEERESKNEVAECGVCQKKYVKKQDKVEEIKD